MPPKISLVPLYIPAGTVVSLACAVMLQHPDKPASDRHPIIIATLFFIGSALFPFHTLLVFRHEILHENLTFLRRQPLHVALRSTLFYW